MVTATGSDFDLTLLQIVDPATAVMYSPPPAAGDNYVGVQFRITDTGSATVTEDPNNFVTVVDGTSRTFSPDFNTMSDCMPFGSIGSVNVAPGNNTIGCVAFQVPTGDALTGVVAGTAGMTPAEWKLTS
jgi:hypothetical protein